MKSSEYKFRAWDKDRKRMMFDCKWVEYRHSKDGTMTAVNYDRCGNEQKLEVLQYTGLKDKNGKGAEMCQGDLVYAYGHGVGEVQKNHWGEWGLVFEDSTETIHNLIMEQDLEEIVGTVYENPELLEVVK